MDITIRIIAWANTKSPRTRSFPLDACTELPRKCESMLIIEENIKHYKLAVIVKIKSDHNYRNILSSREFTNYLIIGHNFHAKHIF